MEGPSALRVSAHSLTFLNQEICLLCYPRSPSHSNTISYPIVHLSWFTSLGVSTFQDPSPPNRTVVQMFLQDVSAVRQGFLLTRAGALDDRYRAMVILELFEETPGPTERPHREPTSGGSTSCWKGILRSYCRRSLITGRIK